MPTFASIGCGLPPGWCVRSIAVNDTDPREATIDTPLALLSRHPVSLRLYNSNDNDISTSNNIDNKCSHDDVVDPAQLFKEGDDSRQLVGTSQIDQLRQKVAKGILFQSSYGSYLKRVYPELDNADSASLLDSHTTTNNDMNLPPPFWGGACSALSLLKRRQTSGGSPSYGWPTGSSSLDQLLSLPSDWDKMTNSASASASSTNSSPSPAGLPYVYVTQWSGPPASGKTQAALSAVSQAPSSGRVYYLSSDASIVTSTYVERLHSMMANASSLSSPSPPDFIYPNYHHPSPRKKDTIMDRTQFMFVSDEYQLLMRLAQIEQELESYHSCQHSPVGDTFAPERSTVHPHLVIVDNISSCLSTENETALVQVASSLNRLARRFDQVAVLIINGTVSGDSHAKAALGHRWKRAADVHVWFEQAHRMPFLSPTEETTLVIEARLEKRPGHVSLDSTCTAQFCILPHGIGDV
jgi:RecA/RadA recombinase